MRLTALALTLLLAAPLHAAEFTVDSAVDALPGDGACTDVSRGCRLWAAVMETNALAVEDVIRLRAGRHQLAIPDTNENASATGTSMSPMSRLGCA
jgi:hypothetical protein